MASRFSAYPLCRHTKTDAHLCHSPALIDSAYCYHHQKLHRIRHDAISAGPGLSTRVLHTLRNARSIQQALAMVANGISSGQIHPRKAGRMLSALQIASSRAQQGPIE
jgi:hypothetical protein